MRKSFHNLSVNSRFIHVWLARRMRFILWFLNIVQKKSIPHCQDCGFVCRWYSVTKTLVHEADFIIFYSLTQGWLEHADYTSGEAKATEPAEITISTSNRHELDRRATSEPTTRLGPRARKLENNPPRTPWHHLRVGHSWEPDSVYPSIPQSPVPFIYVLSDHELGSVRHRRHAMSPLHSVVGAERLPLDCRPGHVQTGQPEPYDVLRYHYKHAGSHRHGSFHSSGISLSPQARSADRVSRDHSRVVHRVSVHLAFVWSSRFDRGPIRLLHGSVPGWKLGRKRLLLDDLHNIHVLGEQPGSCCTDRGPLPDHNISPERSETDAFVLAQPQPQGRQEDRSARTKVHGDARHSRLGLRCVLRALSDLFPDRHRQPRADLFLAVHRNWLQILIPAHVGAECSQPHLLRIDGRTVRQSLQGAAALHLQITSIRPRAPHLRRLHIPVEQPKTGHRYAKNNRVRHFRVPQQSVSATDQRGGARYWRLRPVYGWTFLQVEPSSSPLLTSRHALRSETVFYSRG